jgi:hypothetical protein
MPAKPGGAITRLPTRQVAALAAMHMTFAAEALDELANRNVIVRGDDNVVQQEK